MSEATGNPPPAGGATPVGPDAAPIAPRSRPLQNLFFVDILRDRGSRPALVWAGSTLLFGMVAYHFLEGWSLLDSLYFSVISLATVGYGDLAPTTPLSKVFTMLYVMNGIAILLSLFDRIRVVRARNAEVPRRRR